MNKLINKQNTGLTKTIMILAIIFSFCVLLQIFFAGMAIFDHPAYWINHKIFVHFFDKLALIMFIIALIGKVSGQIVKYSGSLVLLVFAMYFTANITRIISWVGALHPVIAVVMLLVAVKLIQHCISSLKDNNDRSEVN
jgi:mercuric ion transport protein